MTDQPWSPDEILLRPHGDEWEARLREAPDRVVCDFCLHPEPTTDYDCADFRIGTLIVPGEEPQDHWSREGFLACRECARLIDQGRYSWLVERQVRCWNAAHPEAPADADAFISIIAGFVRNRQGPGRPYTHRGGSR